MLLICRGGIGASANEAARSELDRRLCLPSCLVFITLVWSVGVKTHPSTIVVGMAGTTTAMVWVEGTT